MYKSTYPPSLNYTVPRRVSVLKGALKAPVPPLPGEYRTPETSPRTSLRMRATPSRKALRTQAPESPTVATTQQSIAMSHFPRLSALAEEHGDWPSNWNEFADMAPTTDRLAALRSCGSAPPNRIADGLSDSITRFSQ